MSLVARVRPARCPPQPPPSSYLSRRSNSNSPSSFFFFPLYNCHSFAGKISPLTTSAPCLPLSYPPPLVHSVTVCYTLDCPLSHSLSPTSIIYPSSIAVSFSFAAFLSLVNSSFSPLSPLSAAHSVDLPSRSLTPPRWLALHLVPSLPVPLSSPL